MAPRVEAARSRSPLRFLLEGLEGLVLSALVILTWPVSKRWLRDWGSSRSERAAEWPGDRLVPDPETVTTRAIGIEAPRSGVWPWIVQFGLGRGGFYSYELLERLVGIPVRNVESVLPEFQDLAVGDEILLHPNAPGIPVAEVVARERLCFGVSGELEGKPEQPAPARSWSIYLRPTPGGWTRLLLRARVAPLRNPTFRQRIGRLVEEPIDFVMEQRMLRTLRRLAAVEESGAAPAAVL